MMMRYFISGGLLLSSSLWAAQLTGIEHGELANGGYRLVFKGVAVQPSAFNTDNPASIVLDFADTTSILSNKEYDIGANGIYDVDVIEGQGKIRAVINLAYPKAYDIAVVGRDVILGIAAPTQAAQGSYPAAGSAANTTGAVRVQLTGANKVPPSVNVGKKKAVAHRDLSPVFRKSNDGNGAFSFTLPGEDTVVSVRNEGNQVVADIVGHKVGNKDQKRFEVTDYATPVNFVDVKKTAKGSKVVLDMGKNPYEFLTYQTGNVYTIEVMKPPESDVEKAISELEFFGDDKQYKGEPLSLNFQDIEVRAVLQIIAEFTKNNIVVSDTVVGNITLRLDNVPWDQALDIILKTKGLDKREKGGVIYIAPLTELSQSEIDKLKAFQDKQNLIPVRTELVQIKYARASELLAVIQKMSNNTSNANDEETSILSSRGTITVDARTNTLVVSDVPLKIRGLRDLIAKLDEPVRQVMVDARLVLTRNEFSKDIGARFGASFVNVNPNGTGILGTGTQTGVQENIAQIATTGTVSAPSLNNRLGSNFPASPRGGAPASYGLAILGSDFLIDLELSALQTEGQAEVISSPRVVTQDGSKARIASGTKIPQVKVDDGTATISYEEAELSLDVTPRIAPDDMVDMQLQVTNNKEGREYLYGGNRVSGIDTNELETNVLVENGETIVLGGIFEQDQRVKENKVPLLGSIPIVGSAFKNKTNVYDKSELLIFVTPRIIDKRLSSNDKFSSLRED